MPFGLESFSTDPVVGGETAAEKTHGIALPWRATQITLVNDKAQNVYFSVNSTVATTNDFYLKSGESHTFAALIEVIGLATTTTSTGTTVRVGAWRG